MSDSSLHPGIKRRHSSFEEDARKKQRVHHRLHQVQGRPIHAEPAPQTPVFAQGQLLRSLTAALALVGFDSVEPSALEMFRSHTEEYMLKLLSYVRESMQNGRRRAPTATDFSLGLSLMPNAQTASLLRPQLTVPLPEAIAYPSIPEPAPDEPPPPDLSALLAPLLETPRPVYVPKHFPALPPCHSWKETPVFAERETDPKKMREISTQEGMMAEQALRRLAAAAKAGALKVERKRGSVLNGQGRARGGPLRRGPTAEEAFTDVLHEVEDTGEGEDVSHAKHDNSGTSGDGGAMDHIVVNYEMGQWRHGGRRTALRL